MSDASAAQPFRLVLLEWEDSHHSAGWQPIEGIRDEVLVCQSVGWLIYDGERSKVVAPHLSHPEAEIEAQGNGFMTIPARCVLRVVELQEVEL